MNMFHKPLCPFSSLFIGIWAAAINIKLNELNTTLTFSSLFIGIWAAALAMVMSIIAL